MNIFHPRVNNRGATDGITGMQFPAFEYGLACIYKVTGEHFWVNRLWSLLLFSLGILFMYWWVFLLSGSTGKGCMAAWFFCWSPELFYHGINALPDVLAITAAIGSLATAYYYLKNRKVTWMLVSMLMLLLAGLTKIQYLMAGSFWIVLLFLPAKNEVLSRKEKRIIFFSGCLVAIGCVGWYVYAMQLIASSGLADVGLEFRPQQNWQLALETIRHNLVSDIPELLIGYASLVFLIVGIYILFKYFNSSNVNRRPYYLWLFLFVIYYLAELSQMDEHNYYLLPCLPLLVLIAVAGADYLFKKRKIVFILLMLSQPVLSAIRIIPSRWTGNNNELPAEFVNAESRNKLQSAVENDAICIMANDPSGCIWFYFLEKKGFCEGSPGNLKSTDKNGSRLEVEIEKGARYLYSIDSTLQHDDFFTNHIEEKILQEGSFSVFKLKKL